ncbi:MAG: 30S ribosomal protein S20 [Lachnospirales bacterium]
MANIKSAKKRVKVIKKKTLRNKMIKTRTKSAVKNVTLALENKNVEEAKANLKDALTAIDKACSKGIYHKNTAARKKSRLTKAVNKAV